MIQIDEMVLRVPGMREEEAGSLGQQVAELVSNELPDDLGNHIISDLNIRIDAAEFSGNRSMAMHIAEQIVREIKLALYR
jgi:hypothetical protein